MENNKGQTIFLSVVGVATLLVAIVGATFAYFSVTVTGNENASSIKVVTATLTSVNFADGNTINLDPAYPGAHADKTFTVTSDKTAGATYGSDTVGLEYYVWLNVTDADLITTLHTQSKDSEFNYSLSCSAADTGAVKTSVGCGGIGNDKAGASIYGNYGTSGNRGETSLYGPVTIYPGSTHTYTFRIQFTESSSDQNYAQGHSFAGVIQVESVGGNAQRWTAGSDGTGSSLYTSN